MGTPRTTKGDIVVGVCASASMRITLALIAQLQRRGFGTPVIMTPEAAACTDAKRFRTASREAVNDDMFETPRDWDVRHISLARRASLLVICPATAVIIAKIACGICDDLLTCVVCATKAPVLLVTSMDASTASHAVTRENVEKLRTLGYHLLEPGTTKRNGSFSSARIAETSAIVQKIEELV